MEYALLGLAALMIASFAFFVGRETTSWWAVTWPLLVPALLLVYVSAAYLLEDQSDCIEGCEYVFALLAPSLTLLPAAIWVFGAAGGRLMRRS